VPTRAGERLRRPETVELIRSYYAIADWQTRHEFLAMVKAVPQAHTTQPRQWKPITQDRIAADTVARPPPHLPREKDPHR